MVFVVVPAYNEGLVLKATVDEIVRSSYQVIVVDDGSLDNTRSVMKDLPVYYLRHPVNLGQGAALQTGMTLALGLGAQAIVHFDADGQHAVGDIKGLVEPILAGEADIVFGSRFLREGDSTLVPPSRRLVLKLGVLFNGLMTGIWLTDAHNGLRAMSKSAAQSIRIREDRFAHASDILMQTRRHRLRYLERPARVIYSTYSIGKGQRAWNALNVVVDLLLGRILK